MTAILLAILALLGLVVAPPASSPAEPRVAAAPVAARSAIAPAVPAPEPQADGPKAPAHAGAERLRFVEHAPLDLHMLVREWAAKKDEAPEHLAAAVREAKKVAAELGNDSLWGPIESAVFGAADLAALRGAAARLPEEFRLSSGRALKLREVSAPYLAALAECAPEYERLDREARTRVVAKGRESLAASTPGALSRAFEWNATVLGAEMPAAPVPVVLVGSAPFPHAHTFRAAGVGGVCVVAPQEFEPGVLAEMVIHESIHALDVANLGKPTALARIREALRGAGVAPTQPAFRDAPHTVMFAQAAESVRRHLDPAHEDYGDTHRYYSKVGACGTPVRDVWRGVMSGEKTVAQAADAIVAAVAAGPAAEPK